MSFFRTIMVILIVTLSFMLGYLQANKMGETLQEYAYLNL